MTDDQGRKDERTRRSLPRRRGRGEALPPTVMLFVQSLRGISHNKIEDTKEEHIEMSVKALDRLASETTKWIGGLARRFSP
jgi:hypothetical protein